MTACKHTVSGSISLPCSGFFSPFLHSTSALSVFEEYLALPDGAGRFPQGVSDLAVLRVLLRIRLLYVHDYHVLWCNFPEASTGNLNSTLQPYNPPEHALKFGLFPFRSPLLGKSLNCFLFLGVLRCFSSPGSHIIADIVPLQGTGLPHSEISGSKCMCHSPKLIAAYHVLHRLSNPRHPPYALSNFQILNILKI